MIGTVRPDVLDRLLASMCQELDDETVELTEQIAASCSLVLLESQMSLRNVVADFAAALTRLSALPVEQWTAAAAEITKQSQQLYASAKRGTHLQ